jgi:hypothetical protein
MLAAVWNYDSQIGRKELGYVPSVPRFPSSQVPLVCPQVPLSPGFPVVSTPLRARAATAWGDAGVCATPRRLIDSYDNSVLPNCIDFDESDFRREIP